MSTGARRLLLVLAVLLLTLCACTTALLTAGVARHTIAAPDHAGAPSGWQEDAPPVWFELRAQGSTLIRSAAPVRADADYRNVGWIICADGAQILHRSAENETRYDLYRCPDGAHVTAYVTVWSEGAYRRASEEVTVECH